MINIDSIQSLVIHYNAMFEYASPMLWHKKIIKHTALMGLFMCSSHQQRSDIIYALFDGWTNGLIGIHMVCMHLSVLIQIIKIVVYSLVPLLLRPLVLMSFRAGLCAGLGEEDCTFGCCPDTLWWCCGCCCGWPTWRCCCCGSPSSTPVVGNWWSSWPIPCTITLPLLLATLTPPPLTPPRLAAVDETPPPLLVVMVVVVVPVVVPVSIIRNSIYETHTQKKH